MTPAYVDVGVRPPLPAASPRTAAGTEPSTASSSVTAYDQGRLLAGHLLRRAGFGPTPKELRRVERRGLTKWIDQQLDPQKINDSTAERAFPPGSTKPDEDYDRIRRWYVRMATSRRQLQEKMTLIWHEHFATSDEKVHAGLLMSDQEEFLRANSLGVFRDLLIGITKDQAMLIWLDNNYNNGRAAEPPNENYAREFLQLFTVGTTMLNLDGTSITDAAGRLVPAYTENDVREIARALTGWYVHFPYESNNAQFGPLWHDEGPKTIMGVTLAGRAGDDGANEVQDVVDLVLARRETTVAAFISKSLIEKLATETPTPRYVSDIASVFLTTGGDIKEVVRAILTDPEFTSPAVVRSQFKEPIEQFIGAVRALEGETQGDALIDWTYDAGQLIYYPPSVFSFYPPGNKGTLVSTAYVLMREKMADEFVRGSEDTGFDPAKLLKKGKLKSTDQAVDYLSDLLLAAPLQAEVRTEIINFMNDELTDEKLKGAVWLILCSPDFQRN